MGATGVAEALPTSRRVTEFLRFNPRWTDDDDRAIIEEHLDATGATAFEEVDPPGYNHYVEVCDADGNVLMHVSKGTIYREGAKHRLSTTRGDRQA